MYIDYFSLRTKIRNALYKFLSWAFYSHFFNEFGVSSKIVAPLSLSNTKNIRIGDKVTINKGVFMMVSNKDSKDNSIRLSIGNGTVIGHFNHIVSLNSVIIEDNVLTADRVYISDNAHGYADIATPILQQGISSKGPTCIGEGSWLGENVCVISANVGKHCVIAANSVVLSDIPDYSIAAGSPAKVKKRYDFNKKLWVKI